MSLNQDNMFQFPINNNQMNQMKINNSMGMNNLINNPIGISNMMNNQILMNNMMINPIGMNNMTNNPAGMNNMMNNPIGMNNMMNNQMGMNNIKNNQMGMNNIMNNQMGMNNMMNMQIPNNNQMVMNQSNQIFPMQNQNIINNNIQINKEPIILPKQKKIKRKIPLILQKNANRIPESITFQVEKGLKPTDNLLYYENVTQIFKGLFEKRKKELNQRGELVYVNRNEPLPILHYKFDTNVTEFANYDKKSLIQGLAIAYGNHFPINVSPDMIWLLILQGYARFMEKYSELVREKYVNFQGKKTLYVNKFGTPLNEATEEDWKDVIDECVDQISDHVGKEMISNLQSDFSTTNAVTLSVSQTSIMSAMKQYFVYKGIFGICGISYITLEGSVEDWEKIKSKLNYISKFALNWWTKHLIPIIDNIIKTKKYYAKYKKINNELVDFWKNMIKIKDKNGEYVLDVFNGWIIKFIPDLSGDRPKLYEELGVMDVPDQIISCPLELLDITNDGFKSKYKCDIASGFFGMTQDKKTLTVKPVIGYAIVVEDKETSPLTEKEKDEIIKNYFN